MAGGVGADVTLLPVGRGAVLMIGFEGAGVVLLFIAEVSAEGNGKYRRRTDADVSSSQEVPILAV
jgi:hypothetical protein